VSPISNGPRLVSTPTMVGVETLWWSLCAFIRTFHDQARVCDVRVAASLRLRTGSAPRPRQRQHRLSEEEAAELVASYRQQKSIKQLAQQFAIHRTTVAARLRRSGALGQGGRS
jgi:hypothetical protein